jgi:hypothetical protein
MAASSAAASRVKMKWGIRQAAAAVIANSVNRGLPSSRVYFSLTRN